MAPPGAGKLSPADQMPASGRKAEQGFAGKGEPKALAAACRPQAGVNRRTMMNYFAGTTVGVALSATAFASKAPLAASEPKKSQLPPQTKLREQMPIAETIGRPAR